MRVLPISSQPKSSPSNRQHNSAFRPTDSMNAAWSSTHKSISGSTLGSVSELFRGMRNPRLTSPGLCSTGPVKRSLTAHSLAAVQAASHAMAAPRARRIASAPVVHGSHLRGDIAHCLIRLLLMALCTAQGERRRGGRLGDAPAVPSASSRRRIAPEASGFAAALGAGSALALQRI